MKTSYVACIILIILLGVSGLYTYRLWNDLNQYQSRYFKLINEHESKVELILTFKNIPDGHAIYNEINITALNTTLYKLKNIYADNTTEIHIFLPKYINETKIENITVTFTAFIPLEESKGSIGFVLGASFDRYSKTVIVDKPVIYVDLSKV